MKTMQLNAVLRSVLLAAATLTALGTVSAASAGERATKAKAARTKSVERSRGADGAIDKLSTGPKGGTRLVDRSRNADGTMNKTVTATLPTN